ncbi:hypothetical protein LPJ53_005007 [Coemansia erecta]|uniref:CAP-Gly domain-containing protein n=1 Tax=Coemansia erecta TaxID=147472 RepID=A0A9W7XX94_9FUNG|nr:hypothetical protein LPJ53_005007 [Coemansia erecta]
MNSPDTAVGRCFRLGSDLGIVRYQGAVDGADGEWLGVEWLTPNRGKHDGSKSGRQYFRCQQPGGPHASFIRPVSRITWGRSLLSAAKHHYVVSDLSELSNNIPQTIDGRRGRIEAVGLDKIAREQSDLTKLAVLNLDACMVDGPGPPGEREETAGSLRNVESLSLARNLLTRWDCVLDILRMLPRVGTLDISANHFVSPVPVTSETFAVDTLRVDTTPLIAWPDAVGMARQLGARSLSFGWCRLSDISGTPADWGVQELHLVSNQITDASHLRHLPSLHTLNLQLNPLAAFAVSSASDFASLHTLNLSNTLIDSWASIDALARIPSLRTIHIRDTPLTQENARAQIIARLPQITKLDGSIITPDERTEMERYYLAQCARSVNPDLPLVEQMEKVFPRVRELIAKHGMPPPPPRKQESSLKSRLAKVTIEVVRDNVELDAGGMRIHSEARSLIPSMLVRQLRPVVVRIAKARKFRIYLSNDGERWVELDNDTRPLSFYGIGDGSVIRIVV